MKKHLKVYFQGNFDEHLDYTVFHINWNIFKEQFKDTFIEYFRKYLKSTLQGVLCKIVEVCLQGRNNERSIPIDLNF